MSTSSLKLGPIGWIVPMYKSRHKIKMLTAINTRVNKLVTIFSYSALRTPSATAHKHLFKKRECTYPSLYRPFPHCLQASRTTPKFRQTSSLALIGGPLCRNFGVLVVAQSVRCSARGIASIRRILCCLGVDG